MTRYSDCTMHCHPCIRQCLCTWVKRAVWTPSTRAAKRPAAQNRDRSAFDLSGGGWGGTGRPCPAPAYAARACAASPALSAVAGWRPCIQSAACCAFAATVKIARLSPRSTLSNDAT